MSFTRGHLAEVSALVRAVARAEIMPRFRRLGADAITRRLGRSTW